MPFPWGQPTLPVSFTCPHCGDVKSIMHEDKVQACDCPGAQEDRILERQRNVAHAKTTDELYKARMEEARRQRRERRNG
jgi:hypothetical protein